MKKALILCGAVILVVLGVFGYQVYLILHQQAYDGDVLTYGAAAVEGEGMTAEVDGQTLELPNWMLDSLVSRLTTATRQRKLLSQAPADAQETLRIHLGSECEITLYRLDELGDATVVQMDSTGRDYLFRLDGYKLFYWVKKVITQK